MHSVDGLLLSSMCPLSTHRCDLDQPGWICRLIPFVEAHWLSGRMPDSRSRGHRHESSTHIGAVDDDRLWQCYATTKYNHCTIVLVLWKKLWFFYLFTTQLPRETAEWLPSEADLFVPRYMTPHLVLLVWSYRWKYGTICSNEYKSQMPSLLTLMNSNRTPATCMYWHKYNR